MATGQQIIHTVFFSRVLGGAGDGGGIQIWIDGSGRVHIRKIPPDNPMAAILGTLVAASHLQDPAQQAKINEALGPALAQAQREMAA